MKTEATLSREQIFVQIGVQQRLFTKEQVEDARRSVPAAPTLGEALITRGVLSRDQQRGLERAVTYRLGRDEDKRIAQIIVDSGYCPEARVQEALKRQKDVYGKSGDLMRLAALLLDDGAITDSQQVAAHKIFQIEKLNLKPGTLESR